MTRIPLLDMEKPGNPALCVFREMGGPGLLVPTRHGGRGATPRQAVRVQRALGSRSPSLAVATTMHHFSVAALVEMTASDMGSGLEWMLLEGIAGQHLYVASAFAEGRPGASILSSAMEVRRTAEGLVISGRKRPCSLSASMDLLTASIMVPDASRGERRFAVAIIPATTPGIERRPFWSGWVLAGAESDEVILRDVMVPENLVSYLGGPGRLEAIQDRSFLWFELLIAASYLGIASALVERVLRRGKGTAGERASLAVEVEGAMAGLEGVARAMMMEEPGNHHLARMLLVRFAVQEAVERASARAAELLGGMEFAGCPEVAYLHAASRALAFHPPSRLGSAVALDAYLAGKALVLG